MVIYFNKLAYFKTQRLGLNIIHLHTVTLSVTLYFRRPFSGAWVTIFREVSFLFNSSIYFILFIVITAHSFSDQAGFFSRNVQTNKALTLLSHSLSHTVRFHPHVRVLSALWINIAE